MRSLEHRPELRGWTAWLGYRRQRVAAKLANRERRNERMAMDIDNTSDEQPISVLSDSLDAYSVEIRK
jgi:hypothetical protein